MVFWAAGIIAAGTAWLLNSIFVRKGGSRYIVFIVPWLEEILKTGTAALLETSMPLTHVVFGFIEAIHDITASKKWGFSAGVLSVVGHCLFGCITLFVYQIAGGLVPAVLMASATHVLWNLLMLRFFAYLQKKKKK